MSELKSYKPYARFVTVISGIIILISVLDANKLINLFPNYASQITTIIAFAGVIAPAISQEMRVGRAEELVEEEYNSVDSDSIDDDILEDVEE